MILRHRQSPSDPMDHKTPPTYIIKNFREPHENFTPRIKYRGCGGGQNLRKVSLFPNIFFLPRENLSRYLRKLNPGWCLRRQRGSILRITRGIIRIRLLVRRREVAAGEDRIESCLRRRTRISFGSFN